MPTKHPRTHITHTAQVAHALDVARRRWPDETRESALILHLLDEGAKAVEADISDAEVRRRARLRAVAGKYTGAYGPSYLDDLRQGWVE